jgi:hypothetical protein
MKKSYLLAFAIFCSISLMAQCDDLFFSEYVEGYANNKAVEIYNPTDAAINLSGYSIARFSNGSTTAAPPNQTPGYIVQLPDVMLGAHDVFVVVLDKQDMALYDSQFDKPAWNGYNVIDTIFDQVTGEPVTDSLGNVLIGPQYNEDGAALFGDEYNEEYDLQCKADVFLCPSYAENRAMYFNGNDAVALLSGTEVAADGSNLVDVIGVIGEDPETSIEEDAWVDENGFWLTKDRTLVRNADVTSGRKEIADVVFQSGGTFTGEQWASYSKNSFQYLGIHNSTCAGNSVPDEFSCVTGVAAYEVNTIPFNMYPNPMRTGSLQIEAGEKIERVLIYNLMGQLVFSKDVEQANDQLTLDLQRIHAGMYLVNLEFAERQISIQKLVIE